VLCAIRGATGGPQPLTGAVPIRALPQSRCWRGVHWMYTVSSDPTPSLRRFSCTSNSFFLISHRCGSSTSPSPPIRFLSLAVQRRSARCPLCHRRSQRIHSRYHRTLADLPISGRRVILFVQMPRFHCPTPACPRQIFAERLPDLAAPFARRSQPLRHTLAQVGFALGGEAGFRLAGLLGMPTRPDSLLRLIRAAPCPIRARRASSAWTTGRTSAASATAVLSATWSGTG